MLMNMNETLKRVKQEKKTSYFFELKYILLTSFFYPDVVMKQKKCMKTMPYYFLHNTIQKRIFIPEIFYNSHSVLKKIFTF